MELRKIIIVFIRSQLKWQLCKLYEIRQFIRSSVQRMRELLSSQPYLFKLNALLSAKLCRHDANKSIQKACILSCGCKVIQAAAPLNELVLGPQLGMRFAIKWLSHFLTVHAIHLCRRRLMKSLRERVIRKCDYQRKQL